MLDTETVPVTADNYSDPNTDVVDEAAASDALGLEETPGEAWPLAPIRPLAVMSPQPYVGEKAPMARRLAAAFIDRLLPLPFLIPLFWPWALVVLAYDLLRDAQGASVGKRLLGLRTVMVSPDPFLDGQPCTAGRSLLRNLLWAGARLCYLSLLLSPAGFALDVTLCLVACLTPEGRHPGDRIGGTRVVMADRQGGAF